jgi:hypothetical protein
MSKTTIRQSPNSAEAKAQPDSLQQPCSASAARRLLLLKLDIERELTNAFCAALAGRRTDALASLKIIHDQIGYMESSLPNDQALPQGGAKETHE